MTGKHLIFSLAVLAMTACLKREYSNPFLADGHPDLEEGWNKDNDGDGVSDSVAFYAPDCGGGPVECLRKARAAAASARAQAGLGKPKGDTTGGGTPKDTVIIVKPIDPVAVAGIQASPIYIPMGVPKATPAITILPKEAENQGYSITSLDPSIVKVSGPDLIPVKPGFAKVRARSAEGGFTTEFEATVILPDTNVYEQEVSASPLTLTMGGTPKAPDLLWKPANTSNQGYTLVSGDTSVVAIASGDILCRPVSPGEAMVTLKTRARGLQAAFKVTVKPAPLIAIKVQSVSAEDMLLDQGVTGAQPKLTWIPLLATDKSHTLASDNPQAVSVSGTTVNALANGQARITLTSSDGPSTSFTVTVWVRVASVASPNLTLREGSKARPVVTFQPPEASNKAYFLVSGNEKAVKVEGEEISAVKKGSADITVTSHDGAKTSTIKVTVLEKDDDD